MRIGDRVSPAAESGQSLCSANRGSGHQPRPHVPAAQTGNRPSRSSGPVNRYSAHALALVIDPSKPSPRKPCGAERNRLVN